MKIVIKHLQPHLLCSDNNQFEMVSKELLGSTNLSEAQTLHIYEVIKVVIIHKDEYFIFATFQIMTLCFKDFDYN